MDGFTTGQAGGAGLPEGVPGQMQGYLTKQGHFRKTWKKRWFVLEWPELPQDPCCVCEPVNCQMDHTDLFTCLRRPLKRASVPSVSQPPSPPCMPAPALQSFYTRPCLVQDRPASS